MSTSLLIGNKTSPFTRRFRLWLHGRVNFDFKVVDYLNVPADAEYLKSFSPINKLPVWVEGEQKIFESRVIANYLAAKHDWEPLTLEEENMLSMNDAATDTVVNLFLLKRSGIDLNGGLWYIDRQKERLATLLGQLEPWAKSRDEKNPAHWNYMTSSMFSFVDWADYRQMVDFTPYPALLDFLKRFNAKPGIAETSPRV